MKVRGRAGVSVVAAAATVAVLVNAARGGIYASHMRHEDSRIMDALDEVVTIAREAHIAAEVSHIKLGGPTAWGRAAEILAEVPASDFLSEGR